MNPSNPSPLPPRPRDGFVLVGVVMFVLALTILGLSVFSLSSYEAQFMHHAQDDLQAYNDATSGLERARYVLSVTDSLKRVRIGLPPGVDSLVAYQKDANGQWQQDGAINTSETVLVRVRAHVGDAPRALMAQYRFQSNDNNYKRTLTTSNKVYVDEKSSDGTENRDQTFALGNGARLAVDDWGWRGQLSPTGVPQDTSTRPVPVPAVEGPTDFLSTHLPDATPVQYAPGQVARYTLHSSDPDEVKYFYFPDDGSNPDWTKFEQHECVFGVSGRVVLMFQRGFHSDARMTVVSDDNSPTDGLVIVAGMGGTSEVNLGGMKVGLEFAGAFMSDKVPIVLVSDGAVLVDQSNDDQIGLNHYSRYVSIYAGGVYLRGPLSTFNCVTTLDHPANAPEDQPGGLIDWLSSRNALPNPSNAGSAELVLVAGTWQDVTP